MKKHYISAYMRKNKYRLISFLVAVLMAINICGCGLISTTDNLEIEGEPDEDDNNLIVIGFSQPGAESAWRVALTESVKSAFTEEKGYRLIYKDAQSKQDNQIKDIRTFIQQGVDYIILSPIVETGWNQVLEEAKDAGIPVVVCDRGVKVSNESLYTAYAGSNFRKEGQAAVAYVEKAYKEWQKDNGIAPDNRINSEIEAQKEDVSESDELSDVLYENDGEIADLSDDDADAVVDIQYTFNIVHIQGTMGSSAQVGRSAELIEAVAKHNDWRIIAQECGEFTKGKTREVMTSILKEIDGHDIDLIYCENDEEAFGVMAALNEAGLTYGTDGDIEIVSFDGTNMALEMCMNGLINYEVECNPLQGEYLFNIVEQLEHNLPVPKIAYIEESSFTPDSIDVEFIENRQY